jgi:hypothetical protein
MNWKEFLKPNWRKIVIFVIIGIISVLILAYYTFMNTCAGGCVSPNCGQLHCRIRITTLILIPSFPLLTTNFTNVGDDVNVELSFWSLGPNWQVVLVTSIIYWYLLSCLIVWIYDKFRKPKKIVRK